MRFEPAHVFAWAPVRGATYYHFVLRRDGERVYEGFSRRPRLTIPRTVGFTPGAYVWVVRAGRGPRSAGDEGPAIISARFTVRG